MDGAELPGLCEFTCPLVPEPEPPSDPSAPTAREHGPHVNWGGYIEGQVAGDQATGGQESRDHCVKNKTRSRMVSGGWGDAYVHAKTATKTAAVPSNTTTAVTTFQRAGRRGWASLSTARIGIGLSSSIWIPCACLPHKSGWVCSKSKVSTL